MRSIRSRFTIYILLITIIPITAFLVYSLIFVNDDVVASEIQDHEARLDWASQYLDLVNEQIDDIVYSLHLKESLLDDVDSAFVENEEIEQVIRDVLYNNANLLSKVQVISTNSYRLVSFDYENGFTTIPVEYDDEILGLTEEPVGIEYYNLDGEIIILHTINNFSTKNLEGVIVLTLNEELEEKLDDIFSNDAEYALFTDDSEIYNQSVFDLTSLDDEKEEAEYTISSTSVDGNMTWMKKLYRTDLYIVSFVKDSVVSEYNNNLIQTGIVIVIISVGLAIPVSFILSNNLSSPIRKLVSHMKKTKLQPIVTVSNRYDEIHVLETSYNDMIGEINDLIKEKYEHEFARQRAQLKALQAQINPHFLANTFQLIGGMALTNDQQDIYEATIKMSKLIRYSMKINQDTTTLREEILHMNDYLDIQKLRFGDNLSFDVDIDTKVKDIKLPMLTIQPIIENAFKHGLKKEKGIWVIGIKTEISDNVNIYISDNGKGMKESDITTLNKTFIDTSDRESIFGAEGYSGIGLQNIDQRIKLLYGNEFGLRIESNTTKGITVCISIPNKEVI